MLKDSSTMPDIAPHQCALELLEDIERQNGIPLTDMVEISYVRLALMLCPGIRTIIPSDLDMFYEVDLDAAHWISVAAVGNSDAHDMLVEICRANIFSGHAIPRAMRARCSLLVLGKVKPTAKSGPKAGQRFGLFFVSYYLARYLNDAFGIPKIRGDGYDSNSAADVLAEVLCEKGVNVTYTQIRDYLSGQKHADSREKSDWLIAMMREPFLRELGLVKNARHFSMSPFGLFMPMGRIT